MTGRMKAIHFKNRSQTRKPRPLRIQLTIITSITICAGLLSILLLNSRFSTTLYQNRQKRLLAQAAKEITALTQGNRAELLAGLAAIETKSNLEIEIYNANGTLVYDTLVNRFASEWLGQSEFDLFQSLMNKRNRETVRILKQEPNGVFEIQQDSRLNRQYLTYTAQPDSGGFIRVSSQLDFINNTANATTRQVSLLAGATFFVVIVVLYLFLRRATDPIREMNLVTRRMAGMDFSQKCTARTNNELRELSDNINTLSESLDRTLRDLQEKNRQLEADIEHERKLEAMRRTFVSNASHELKTPIAIVQGYAEGLKLGIRSPGADGEEYCDVILEETRKMNRLVNSMLELSKYEAGAYELNRQPFDVKEFLEEEAGSFAVLAKEKGVELIAQAPPGLTAYGDPEKLETVLNNYVSNALSHADGEKRIEITSVETENGCRVSVFNTGEPIDESELPNIWQSFYRADKSRSRSQGRFGLGLSICKAILELHRAPYGVINRENGVTFWFEIPKAPDESETE